MCPQNGEMLQKLEITWRYYFVAYYIVVILQNLLCNVTTFIPSVAALLNYMSARETGSCWRLGLQSVHFYGIVAFLQSKGKA